MPRFIFKDRSGMVLMIVLMVVMVMMIMTVTILTQSLNQSTSSKKQIDQIREEELAKGLFWQFHSSGANMPIGNLDTVTMDGQDYGTSVEISGKTTRINVNSP